MKFLYLVQPGMAIGTNRYKIGKSTRENYARLDDYGKKKEIVLVKHIKSEYDINTLENELIKSFNNNFKLFQGKEYFEGDRERMIEIFNSVVIDIYIDNNINNSNYITKEKKIKSKSKLELFIEELKKYDWKSETIDLIDRKTYDQYALEFERNDYDLEKYKKMIKFNFYENFNEDKLDMFDEVFNEWFIEEHRKYISNISGLKVALKQKVQEYINKKNPTKYVEYFKQNLLAFQHCVYMLDKLNLLTENKTDLNFKNEFSTLEFQPLIDTYKNMKSLSINQLFHDEYYDMKTKDRKEKTITTRSIHTILNKILKEYFNYEIESCGKKQKTIDGKRKKITMYKIVPNQEKDENSKLPPIKHNLFEFIKLDQFVNTDINENLNHNNSYVALYNLLNIFN